MTQALKDSQIAKQRDIDLLRKRYTVDIRRELNDIDYRLAEYFDDLTTNVSVEFGDENDRHNRWEVMCGAKFLRMFRTYNYNKKFVRFVIRFREGTWQRNGKMWRYVSGGLKLPSTSGAKVYRWQPFQVFVLAAVFGFMAWFNTHVEEGTKPELLSSERERDGFIWDFRRLINEFIMYGPRKIDKTGLSAYIQVIFFLFGDFNSEIYSLAMTQDQSKILFDRTKFMLQQVSKDKDGIDRFRMTQKIVDWKEKYQKEMRNSKIVPLTGGGKAPDGTNTELLDWDELGSSPYVNGKSDMLAHINVCQSSMGQRRQPLTFGTTTAGTITTGPFIEKLEVLHKILQYEHDYEDGTRTPTMANDGTMCLLLEPDEYEREDEQYLLTSHALRRKINPMLGLVVQYDFYEREMEKARNEGGQKFAECVAKLFNVYQNGKIKDWIKPDEIRAIQIPKRIDDCTADQGWEVMCGLDFSKGDDLNGCSYLAKRWREDLGEMEYFADMDAYMSEDAVNENPIRDLLRKWADDGWLHIVPGKTFDPAVAVNRIIELDSKNVNFFGFGYDPYNAKTVINALTQWLYDIGLDSKQLIKPVRQNFSTYSPAVKEFDYMVRRGIQTQDGKVTPNPMIHLSMNPLWPWEFGNVSLQESNDGMENLKPVKANGAASCKVDNVQMLLSALILHDAADSDLEAK